MTNTSNGCRRGMESTLENLDFANDVEFHSAGTIVCLSKKIVFLRFSNTLY